MRKWIVFLSSCALVAVFGGNAAAQSEKKEEPATYLYATYFVCDIPRQWAADDLAKTVWAPINNAAIEAGKISAWGWLAHHTGGPWRRALWVAAPSIEALLDAQDDARKKSDEAAGAAMRDFGAICGTHEDYIWKKLGGTALDRSRGKAAFSVYMECEMSGEERADEIVSKVLGPVYDRYVKEGKLVSWSWFSHIVGGEWRRLATMSAPDHKALLKARAALLDELSTKYKKEMDEFGAICGSHRDYMWDITEEKP